MTALVVDAATWAPPHTAHHLLRGDLARLTRTARTTALTDDTSWATLARRWEVFSGRLCAQHRAESAELWRPLRRRVGPDEAVTLDAIAAAQDAIEAAAGLCGHRLWRMVAAPDADARAALVVRLDALTASVDRLLEREEADGFELW